MSAMTSWAAVTFAIPIVRESLNLARGLAPVFFREQDVVIGIGVERRVQENEVNRLVLHIAAENVQVVPVVEQIGRAFRHNAVPPFMYSAKSFSDGSMINISISIP